MNNKFDRSGGIFGIFGSNDSCNPYVLVEVDKKKKYTGYKKKVISCIFNEVLTFNLEKKTKVELDTIAIKISVYDKGLVRDTLLGIYELDLTSIYFAYQHEYYRVWMAVTDPTDAVEGSTGFVNANISVLGPDDELPVHDLSTEKAPGSGTEMALIPSKVT